MTRQHQLLPALLYCWPPGRCYSSMKNSSHSVVQAEMQLEFDLSSVSYYKMLLHELILVLASVLKMQNVILS